MLPNRKAILQLRDVTKTYYGGEDAFDAIKNINLDILQGEFQASPAVPETERCHAGRRNTR